MNPLGSYQNSSDACVSCAGGNFVRPDFHGVSGTVRRDVFLQTRSCSSGSIAANPESRIRQVPMPIREQQSSSGALASGIVELFHGPCCSVI